ncbi:glycosyltransferase [Marichromatium bheemlicum]|uniref:Glycosyltransferase n=1 Tax=Marichromatium bheemlicum TaxID=365339 RepID=A0ABX1I7Y3_9GAMM|nr:glycosyltransferase [Marichromatium bheemlicum]NKN33378.1 glycosyltransferase [Marichromatium bheemlicum]
MSAEASSAEHPFVSVIIPVLDGVDEVDGCIAALRAQRYPSTCFEILVVDNGSSDGTPEALAALGVRCLVRAERGRSRALNTGLAAARGEIICTTDISCRPEPQWIAEVVESFADPAVGCVAGEIVQLGDADGVALRYQARNGYMSPLAAAGRIRAPFMPYADGANASFRRALFERIGPFEESFIKAADVEICYRMLLLTDYHIAFNPRARVGEPGEPSLRALLRQRYRIGVGQVLLQIRFPGLFAALDGTSWRARYWGLREALLRLADVPGLVFRALYRGQARARLADRVIGLMMRMVQRLGFRVGVRRLRLWLQRPQPLHVSRMEDYVAGRWSVAARVVRH